MPILLFRTPTEAKAHIKRLHRALQYYEVNDGSGCQLSLQQIYHLVANTMGFCRWEDLSTALSHPHTPRYLDQDADLEQRIRALAQRFANHLGESRSIERFDSAITVTGFGCSPAKYASSKRFFETLLATGLTATQLGMVTWVNEAFRWGTRYGVPNYGALYFLKEKSLAKYLGQPIPPKPRGVKISKDDKGYERMLCRILGVEPG